ncbi:putative Ig domain-containing protein, partial [Chitinimonas sp.]|uniref:putative Ig domain-containing protein n=1 Tax=Chitinimonas sp. TaxID=1934313 RepID=UPI0035AE42FC
ASQLDAPPADGFVSYTVRPLASAPSEAYIEARATIQFDQRPPVQSARLRYQLDADAPTTQLTVRQRDVASAEAPSFLVKWQASDAASGVRHVTVYVAEDGGDFHIWQRQVAGETGEAIYTGRAGHRYEFLAAATDIAGNRQAANIANAVLPNDGSAAQAAAGVGSNATVQQSAELPRAPQDRSYPSSSLFEQAQHLLPGFIASQQAGDFQQVLAPLALRSFADGFGGSSADIGALAMVQLPDHTVLASAGASRNQVFAYGKDGGHSVTPLFTLDSPVLAMAVDRVGQLWVASGSELLQVDPHSGAVLARHGGPGGMALGQALAIDAASGLIYISSQNGVESFNPAGDATHAWQHFSGARVGSLAMGPDHRLWGVRWSGSEISSAQLNPHTDIVSFDMAGRYPGQAQREFTLDGLVERISFGQTGTPLEGLLFASCGLPQHASQVGQSSLPHGASLLMVELASQRVLRVASGGSRGEALLSTADGRLLVAGTAHIDELAPIKPPHIEASSLPDGAVLPLPLNQVSIVFDQAMWLGANGAADPGDAASVLNPANYRLIASDAAGAITLHPSSVSWDATRNTVVLNLPALTAGSWALEVMNSLKSAAELPLAARYTSQFSTVLDFSSQLRLSFSHTRANHATGEISYDVSISNIGDADIRAPLTLLIDPGRYFNGQVAGAGQQGGLWLLKLDQALAAQGGKLAVGATLANQTVTLLPAASLGSALGMAALPHFDLGHGVYALPYTSAPPSIEVQGGQPGNAAGLASLLTRLGLSDRHALEQRLRSLDLSGRSQTLAALGLPANLADDEYAALLAVRDALAAAPEAGALASLLRRLQLPDQAALARRLAASDIADAGSEAQLLSKLGLPADVPASELDALYAVWDAASVLPPDAAVLARLLAHLNLADRAALDARLAATDLSVASLPAIVGLPRDASAAELEALYAVAQSLDAPTPEGTPTASAVQVLPAANAGQPWLATLVAHDADSARFYWQIVQGPAGLTLTADADSSHDASGYANTATLRWTPTSRDLADTRIVVRVSDSLGGVSYQQLSLQVAGGNQRPVIDRIANVDGVEGQAISLPISASDADGDALTLSVRDLPAGARFDAASGRVVWTPGYGQAGDYTVTVLASDGKLSSSQRFTIHIAKGYATPQFAALASQQLREGEAFALRLAGSLPGGLTLADGSVKLSFSAPWLPAGASLDEDSGWFRWTPGYTQAGNVSLPITLTARYTSAAGGEVITRSVQQVLSLQVDDAAAAPVFGASETWHVLEGQPLAISVFAFDPNHPDYEIGVKARFDAPELTGAAPNPLHYQFDQLPPGAHFDTQTAQLFWTPDYTQAGSYQVVVTATSVVNGISKTASTVVPIVVEAAYRAPQLAAIAGQQVQRGASLVIPLSATDPAGQAVQIRVEGLPAFARFDPEHNRILANPGAGDRGAYTVTVTASNDGGGDPAKARSSSQQFVLTAISLTEPPRLSLPAEAVAVVGQTLRLPLRVSDLDQDPLSFAREGLPEGAVIERDGYGRATLVWTPTADQLGQHDCTITVSDSGLPPQHAGQTLPPDFVAVPNVVSKALRLTVKTDNGAPQLMQVSANGTTVNDLPGADHRSLIAAEEGRELSVQLLARDLDGDALHWTLEPLPTGASLSETLDADGRSVLTLRWTPDRFAASGSTSGQPKGLYRLSATVSDGMASQVQTLDIQVAHRNQAPEILPMPLQLVHEGDTL